MRINIFLTILFFVAVLDLTQPLTAQEPQPPRDGNQFLKECTQSIRSMDGETLTSLQLALNLHCVAYIEGFTDAPLWYVLVMNGPPLYCFPEGVKVGQATRIVVKWMKDHPESLHFEKGIIIGIALKIAFPCKE